MPIYLRLNFEQNDAARREWRETPEKWNALPIDEIPLAEAKAFITRYKNFYRQFELGARRKKADPMILAAGSPFDPVYNFFGAILAFFYSIIPNLGVAIILGYALLGSYAWYARAKNLPNAPQLDWKAAQWLPVYLVGIGIISWQGGFGVGAEGHIHLWWDMGIIAVFSLAVYYWALAVGLKREAIERNIDEVAVVDEGGH